MSQALHLSQTDCDEWRRIVEGLPHRTVHDRTHGAGGQPRRHVRREPALGRASETEPALDVARHTRVHTRADSTATIAARAFDGVLRTTPVGSVSPTVSATGSDLCTAVSTLRPKLA